jgi:hypothetical protein
LARVEVVASEPIHLPAEDAGDLAAMDPPHEVAEHRAARRLRRVGLLEDFGDFNASTQRQLLELLDLGTDREDLPILGF